MERLSRQIGFLLEIDKAKRIIRRSRITDGTRYENDGEHMWHVALAAAVLAEHADEAIDVSRVIRMLLVHDIVEIDAGDAFLYDAEGRQAKAAKERAAADRIFGILPSDQARAFRELWDEYEGHESPESRFAAAVDRLLPLLLNWATQGSTWQEHSIESHQVLNMNASVIGASSEALWAYACEVIDECVAKGFLATGDPIRADG